VRSRRPPLRRCPACGGDVYNWLEGALCRTCVDDALDGRLALTEMTRARREARIGPQTPQPAAAGPTDDIPY